MDQGWRLLVQGEKFGKGKEIDVKALERLEEPGKLSNYEYHLWTEGKGRAVGVPGVYTGRGSWFRG